MEAGPIPFTAIVEYARIYNVEDMDEFIYLIRRMDSRILSKRGSKDDKSSKRSQDKS